MIAARESGYAPVIREDLAVLGLAGRYDVADVEAWMRDEHGTLDNLSRGQFRAAVKSAAECVDAAEPWVTRTLRECYGL